MLTDRGSPERYHDVVDEKMNMEKSALHTDPNHLELPIFENLPLKNNDVHSPVPRKFSSLLKQAILGLIPTFLRCRKPGKKAPSPKITSTTYLNGLRGVAALFVFCHHYLMEYYRDITFYAYGCRPEDNYIIQLPFISLFHSGSFMVAIFFILSGYVLSYKTISLIHKGGGSGTYDATILQNLASSVFRRGPRLYIPLVIPWILTTITVYAGYFTRLDYEIEPPSAIEWPEPSLFAQFAAEWTDFKHYSNLFVFDRIYPVHMSQLWTIPVEFRGSLIVFLLLLCLTKVKHSLRLVIEVSLAYYSLSYDRWDIFLFIWGIIFSELSVLRTTVTDASYGLNTMLAKDPAALKISQYLRNMLWFIFFLVGGWMGSFPFHEDHDGHASPYFSSLVAMLPNTGLALSEPHRYWATIGAVFFMLGMDHLKFLQRPFNTGLVQYLGDISYGFYIVHWTVLRTVGRYVPVYCIAATGSRFWGFLIAFVFDLALTVWLGDIQMRIGDRPSIKISRWLERKAFMGSSD